MFLVCCSTENLWDPSSQEDFALTGDLVTSVKELCQLAGWLEQLEKMSSSTSDDPPNNNSHTPTSSSIAAGNDSSHAIDHQTSDENSKCSHSPNLSYKPTRRSLPYSSPLKEPQIILNKLKDSPELQQSLRKLNKQTVAGLTSQVEQNHNRKLFTQRLDSDVKRNEPTSDEEDVILCASISNMSIT